jgi:hypothetical protein
MNFMGCFPRQGAKKHLKTRQRFARLRESKTLLTLLLVLVVLSDRESVSSHKAGG